MPLFDSCRRVYPAAFQHVKGTCSSIGCLYEQQRPLRIPSMRLNLASSRPFVHFRRKSTSRKALLKRPGVGAKSHVRPKRYIWKTLGRLTEESYLPKFRRRPDRELGIEMTIAGGRGVLGQTTNGVCDGWDRTGARRPVGGGLPAPPFRLRGGFTFPP